MNQIVTVVPAFINSDEREGYFKRSLASIVSQSFPTIGVVVDDSSPRDVQNMVNDANHNGKLRYVHRQRSPDDQKTASNALNMGIDLTLSKSPDVFSRDEMNQLIGVCYLHSDDYLPWRSNAIRAGGISKSGFVYADIFEVGEQDLPLSRYSCGEDIPKDGLKFPHHTSMWSIGFLRNLREYVVKTYGQAGVFDTTISASEDRDVSLSGIELSRSSGEEVLYMNKISYIYRRHEQSITGEMTSHDKESDLFHVNKKHGISTNYMESVISRLTHDMPWSLLAYLPEPIKKHLRGTRDFLKGPIQRKRDIQEFYEVVYQR